MKRARGDETVTLVFALPETAGQRRERAWTAPSLAEALGRFEQNSPVATHLRELGRRSGFAFLGTHTQRSITVPLPLALQGQDALEPLQLRDDRDPELVNFERPENLTAAELTLLIDVLQGELSFRPSPDTAVRALLLCDYLRVKRVFNNTNQ